jgi:hypothetical protein
MTNKYKHIIVYKPFAYFYTIPLLLLFAFKSLILNDLFRYVGYCIVRLSYKITQFYASFCLSDFLKTKIMFKSR